MWEAFQSDGVRGFLHKPGGAIGDALMLTHGAGSNANAPLLVRVAEDFADAGGFLVLRYDLPFRQERAKGPPNPRHAAQDREGIERARKLCGSWRRGAFSPAGIPTAAARPRCGRRSGWAAPMGCCCSPTR